MTRALHMMIFFFFSSRRRHTRCYRDWSSDVCSSDLTHVKRLRELADGVAVLYERIEPLLRSPKLGPILWQLPGTFQRDDQRLADALEQLPHGERHCFEFRHESWFAGDVYALLRALGVGLVISDHPERPFQTHELTAA